MARRDLRFGGPYHQKLPKVERVKIAKQLDTKRPRRKHKSTLWINPSCFRELTVKFVIKVPFFLAAFLKHEHFVDFKESQAFINQ